MAKSKFDFKRGQHSAVPTPTFSLFSDYMARIAPEGFPKPSGQPRRHQQFIGMVGVTFGGAFFDLVVLRGI
jgi:hypothetical protein